MLKTPDGKLVTFLLQKEENDALAFLGPVPDWLSPPGETILDILEERGWSQADLVARMACPPTQIALLINGKANITEEAAYKLERVLGSTAGFWLSREAYYRQALARWCC